VERGYSRDFTNARLTVRIRGELDAQGARLVLLAQGTAGPIAANYVLNAQPIEVTPQWSEQTLTLAPDPAQWTCLGARHDLGHVYGSGDIAALLKNVDIDLIFVLFPINVTPLSFAVMLITLAVNWFVVRYEANAARRLNSEVLYADAMHTRSDLLTSLTVIFGVLSLYFFGGQALRDFSICLLAGFVSGVYSTVYIASALVISWRKMWQPKHALP
jgi:hypothetical protein